MAKIRNKKTGEVREVSDKELSKYGLGGDVDMAKNGKKIKMKLKKADIGKFIPTSESDKDLRFGATNQEDPTFNVGDQGYSEQPQYNPTTGQKFDQFNPALTFGLQNYYQSKGKNAPAYLNNQEANQYADYVNTQPKQQNVNNNTFANNVAPNLPTQGLFNNFYLNKADHYRKQAINSFSKLGQARYGKQLPKAQFGGNDYANLGSGIANAVTADINTAKGYTDIFGTLNMNSQIAQIEAQNKRQNLVSQFENPTPTFQNGWGGNNPLDNGYIPVGEYGTIVKNFESAPKNKHNVEYQGGEGIMIPTENGYVSDYVNSSIKHGDYNSNSASTEGISAALPEGSYVIPGKEISLKEAILPNKKGVLELKQLKTKKAAANVLKPYLDTSMQETLSKDVYSKNSKRLHNQLSQPILTANTEKIEQDKLQGVFGEKVKNSAMKDYEMKYGGVMPETARIGKLIGRKARIKAFQDAMNNQQNSQNTTDEQYFGQNTFDPTVAQTTNIVTNNQPFQITPPVIKDAYSSNTRDPFSFTPFKTQNGIITPQNVNLNAAPETDYESHAQALEKLRGSKFKDFAEYQDYSYSEALKTKEGQAAINKMWLANGLTNKEESKFPDIAKKIKAQQALTLEELTKLKTNFVDGLPGKRIINYTGATTPAVAQTPPADRDSTIPSTIPSQQAEKLNRLKGFNSNITGLQLPDAYLRDPITVNNLQPEYYQPNTITPYLNDIQRLQYATNTNLGTSGADLASRANSFGQGLTEYGKRYYDASVYNAGVKTQASKDNALTKLNTNQFNNSNYINNARNPQLQREAVITEQKRLDREAQLKTFADKEHEQNVNNYLQSIYDPNYALNANFSNPYESKSAKQAQEDAKKAEARKILYGEAKYGKKIKLKPKRKK